MTTAWNIIKDYRNNAAYVRVQGAIINPKTHNRAPFSFECKVDTGFTSGLFYEEALRSDAETVNVRPRPAPIQLGNGQITTAYACIAYLEKIDGYTIPPPGIPVQLYMKSSRLGFIGMEALQSFIVIFDGPNQKFKLKG